MIRKAWCEGWFQCIYYEETRQSSSTAKLATDSAGYDYRTPNQTYIKTTTGKAISQGSLVIFEILLNNHPWIQGVRRKAVWDDY